MKRHRIVHIELPVADREAAARFFADLFGWAFTHYADQQMAAFDTGAISGALNAAEDVLSAPRRVLVYVESDDVAADLDRAEALGGEVLAPRTAIPGVGWFGLFADPAGNTIGLIQFASPQPSQGQP